MRLLSHGTGKEIRRPGSVREIVYNVTCSKVIQSINNNVHVVVEFSDVSTCDRLDYWIQLTRIVEIGKSLGDRLRFGMEQILSANAVKPLKIRWLNNVLVD